MATLNTNTDMTPSEKQSRTKIALYLLQQMAAALAADDVNAYQKHLQSAWMQVDTLHSHELTKLRVPRTIKITTVEPMDKLEGFVRTGFGDL